MIRSDRRRGRRLPGRAAAPFAHHAADGSPAWEEVGPRRLGTAAAPGRIDGLLPVTERDTGSVSAVDAATGATRWTAHDGAAATGVTWSVAGAGGFVSALSGHTLRALHP